MSLILAAALAVLLARLISSGVRRLLPLFTAYIFAYLLATLMWQPHSSGYVTIAWTLCQPVLMVGAALAVLEWCEYAIALLTDEARLAVRAAAVLIAAAVLVAAWYTPAGMLERWMAYRSQWYLGLFVAIAAVKAWLACRRQRQFDLIARHGGLLLAYLGVSWICSTGGVGGSLWWFLPRTEVSWPVVDTFGLAAKAVVVAIWAVALCHRREQSHEETVRFA